MPDHVMPGALLDLGRAIALLAVGVTLLGQRWLVLRCRARGRDCPRHRSACWAAGVLLAALAVTGPFGGAAGREFPAHMLAHLLLGMVAPILLVLAAPVTLVLRAAPVDVGRRISRWLSAPPVRVLTEPAVAALLVAGGSWLLYATPGYALVHERPVLAVVVQVHVLLSGCLLTATLVGVDPMPHRRGVVHRCVVLVLSLAAHDVLAKWLYAHPPTGIDAAAAEVGAQLMYHGGTVVDVALAVLLLLGWYRRTQPRAPAVRAPAVRAAAVPARAEAVQAEATPVARRAYRAG